MVGEMRDLETVDTSLKAAETGHMVFSSIHTADVASTISRLVSFFPTEEQLQVRARARGQPARDRLAAPAAQQEGAPRACRRSRSCCSTRSIQECIKDPAKTHEITDFIARARAEGMQTFDQHLLDLLRANKISVETALAAASQPDRLPDQARARRRRSRRSRRRRSGSSRRWSSNRTSASEAGAADRA